MVAGAWFSGGVKLAESLAFGDFFFFYTPVLLIQ